MDQPLIERRKPPRIPKYIIKFWKVLIALDIIWGILWVISMFIFVFPSGPGMSELRAAHFFLLYHAFAGTILGMAGSIDQPNARFRYLILYAIVFGAFTDVYSVLDMFLHPLVGPSSELTTLLKANAIYSLTISILATIWYSVGLILASNTSKR